MHELEAGVIRIVVMARPALGRIVEAILRNASYEVHRTPDDGIFHSLVARLRPQLVIVELDIPWVDTAELVHHLLKRPRPVPVLLLGQAKGEPRLEGVPRLPLAIDTTLLLATVSSLLATFDSGPD
jgi:chemotaxis response regulator CheB